MVKVEHVSTKEIVEMMFPFNDTTVSVRCNSFQTTKKASSEIAQREPRRQYELYHWTKSTIDDPEKRAKHLKSFAFYEGNNQVYSKELACKIEQRLKDLKNDHNIIEINLIDSNPANNPQPPKRVG